MAKSPEPLVLPRSKPSEPKASILLVDDNPANLLSLRAILEDLGQNLVEARSGEEAVQRVESEEFAVVLLDVLMPGISGFETAQAIRSNDRSRHTPIIFVTASDIELRQLEEGYALGAVDFLVKPLLPVAVHAKVRGFVDLFQDKRQAKQEAEQLRLIVHGTTEYAIFMLDPNGRVVTWNAGAERLKRYKADEIIGQHFSKFYPQEVIDQGWPEHELKVAKAEGRFEDEGWRVRRDGTQFWANVVITALHDHAGNFVGFSKITRDLTERKKSEENTRRLAEETAARQVIQQERERLRVTLASIGDAVISTDAEGRVDFLNPVAQELVGWKTEEAAGRTLEDVFRIVNEDTRQPVENPALRALKEGVIVGLANHTVLIARDGKERPIDDSAAPIRDAGGGVVGSVLVFRDISERKRSEAALNERVRLLTLNAAVGTALVQADQLRPMLQRCAEALVNHLHAAFARIWTLNPQGDVLELQASAGLYTHLDGPHSRVPVGQYKIGLIAQERRPHLTNTVVGDPRVSDHEWAQREGMVAFAGYPLLVDDRLVGVMAMFARQPLSDATVEAMASVANGIAVGVERKVAEEERRRQQEWLRVTLASIGDAMIATDTHGRVTFLNGVAQELTGWTQQDAEGKPLEAVFVILNEKTRRPVENPVEKVLRDGVVVGLGNHTVLVARDGTERPIDDSAAPIRATAGEMIGVVLIFRDVTEQRRSENEVRQSEARKSAILETALDCIITMDHEGKVVEFNPAAEKTFGYSRAEVVGQELARFIIPPSLRDRHRKGMAHYLATGEGPVFDQLLELPALRADGSEFPVELAITRFNVDGPPLFTAYLRNISERKQHEAALRESEEKLRLLADTIPQLAWMARPDGHIFWYNRRWYEYTGTTPEQMEGWGWQFVHDPEVLPKVLERWKGSIASGEPFDMVFPLKGADEQFRPFLTRVNPLRDEEGRILYWFGTNTDVSEIKRMEEALRDADRRKDEFLATLAHELRNPLAPIRNSLQILKLPRLDAATVERSRETMERQVHQLVRLVDDLLDVSRVMRGKIELRKEQVELSAVVARAVETVQPLIEAQGHGLTVSLPPESLPLDADPVRLAQVIGNLLTNSAKYTEANGRIWLTARREGGEAILGVRDDGIGIAPDMLPHIFELFVQADHSSTKAQGGLGIGLTLVKNLVEMHHGTVEAHSDGLGRGSEFVVRLPIMPQEHQRPIEEDNEEEPNEPSRSSGRRLLVVDDNVDAAESLAMLLRLKGHEVQVAHDGPSALKLATSYRPNLVFLDIGMPGMDGYEAARRLRRLPGLENVRLAALTGWGQQEDRRRTAEAGFDHHLVKPAEPEALERLLAD